jgi:hypothetical protein
MEKNDLYLPLNKDQNSPPSNTDDKDYDYPVYNINEIIPRMEICIFCLNEFPIEDLDPHLTTCDFHIDNKKFKKEEEDNSTEIIQCENCSELFGHIDIIQHFEDCYSNLSKCSKDFPSKIEKETPKKRIRLRKKINKIVNDASNDVEMIENEENLSLEEKEKKMLFSFSRQFQNEDLINDRQMKALKYVQSISFSKSQKSMPSLLNKFESLKLGKEGLDIVLNYVADDAPIIIHFNPIKVLHLFVKDTHYRNQFETGISGGTLCHESRILWEDRLFNNIYHSANKADRVKYGVLNIVNDPFGVRICKGYGDSFLVMNNETVRLRTTFASGDSASAVELATCENYCHVLNTFTDNELIDLHTVASRKSFCLESKNIVVYKETQIHGSIIFSRDVSNIVLHHSHKQNAAIYRLANEFSEKFGVNLVWTE